MSLFRAINSRLGLDISKTQPFLSSISHWIERARLLSPSSETGQALANRFTAPSNKPVSLTPKEQDELDRLMAPASKDVLGCVTGIDGFLTSLIVGPPVPAAQWLDFLFDGKPLSDEEKTIRAFALVERRYHHIACDFSRGKPRFQPLISGYSRAKTAMPLGRRALDIGTWCCGFMAGTALCPRQWEKTFAIDDEFSPLYLIWLLGTVEGNEKQWQDVLEYYELEGYEKEEARQMALRWYGLPSTRRNHASALKASVLALHARWHSI